MMINKVPNVVVQSGRFNFVLHQQKKLFDEMNGAKHLIIVRNWDWAFVLSMFSKNFPKN